MARVYLDSISRRFNATTAIEDITFEVPDGEFWVLVGPSGCGKSTILRTIAGLETATSGNLFIGDRLVNSIPARERDVAMVFQNYALYPHMTVAENLAFGLKMRRTEKATIQARIQTVAKSLGIGHLLDRKPRQLSGGQQQRVALGRAIARQPQVFLLDEPLSNLDAQLRDDTRAELKQLHQTLGITTIYVTHDQVEAMTLADRIVVLDRGHVQQIATPQEIYAQPANQMVATFLGSPPMNILPVRYDGRSLLIGEYSLSELDEIMQPLKAAVGDRFNLGIRPEQVQIATTPTNLEISVTVVEPLGRETLIRGTLPDSDALVALQAAPHVHPRLGDRLPLQLDLSQAFIFDPDTGTKLASQIPQS